MVLGVPAMPDRIPEILAAAGVIGIIASALLGIGGWLVVAGMVSGANNTIRAASVVVDDVGAATDAAAVSVSSMRAVVEDIERTARASSRTLKSADELVSEIGDQASGDIADSLESTVAAMPGLIRTGRLIDRTLRALTFVGVDYDPDVPLDEALESLRDSLSPLPEEIRDQAELLRAAGEDLREIGQDAGSLAASLLEIRIDLLEAERVVTTAAADFDEVEVSVRRMSEDLDTYAGWAPWLPVAAAVALASCAAALGVLGLSQMRARRPSGRSPHTPEQ